MPLGPTEPGRQEGLDEIPSYGRSDGPAAHTNNVHVVVLDALPGGEVVVDQTGADTRGFVGTDRGAHAATANRDTAFYILAGNRLSQRNDKVGIVVARRQHSSAVVYYLVARRAKLGNQLFL